MKKLIPLIGFFLIGYLTQFITRSAPPPEQSQNLWYALPAFIVFILLVTGMFSWGAFFRSLLKKDFYSGAEEGMFDLAVGSVFLYVMAYALTPFGLFSSASNWAMWLLLAVGFYLGSAFLRPKKWFDFGASWLSKTLMILVPMIVLLKLIEGLQFHQHGDSYVTYLAAPRSWGANGNFDAFLNFTQLFLSTSWESLFAWGTALMGFRGGAGLDVSQWFSQWGFWWNWCCWCSDHLACFL
jgi:hypothetical protein